MRHDLVSNLTIQPGFRVAATVRLNGSVARLIDPMLFTSCLTSQHFKSEVIQTLLIEQDRFQYNLDTIPILTLIY